MIWLVLGATIPSMFTCWAAAGLLRWLAPRIGLVDRPGPRKVHAAAMPTGGGLAIWVGIAVPLAVGQLAIVLLHAAGAPPASPAAAALPWFTSSPDLFARYVPGLIHQSLKLWTLLAGGTALMLLGLIDDRRGLDWRLRLAVQTLVAAVMVTLGWRADLLPGVPGAAAAISVLWIVGLVNSFNMLDNMDGLSAGVGAIAAAMLAVVMFLSPRPDSGEPQLFVGGLLLVIFGSLVGFLWHNRPPARLFMGDAGSYLVGYLLAMVTLTATFAGGGAPRHATLVPLCVLAVPIYDTASVVLIRLRQGRSLFVGDTSHFSHRLLALGMTKTQALLTIYLAAATCGLGGLLLHEVDHFGAAVVLLLVFCTLLLVAILETAGRRKGAAGINRSPEEKNSPRRHGGHGDERD
jgi:UDP-GlcNAc:undecaprenyl-phosphate GlcNAc-1-phosphate transferase